jgi:diaminopimelate epimerase
MKINFTKMHGIGNDFVVINAMEEKLPEDLNKFSKDIADRHFGIGADQVLIVDKSEIADFKMRLFNNDGSEGEMCGNGIRCIAYYVYHHKLTDKKKINVETLAGIIVPEISGEQIRVDMGEPKFKTKDWDFPQEKVADEPIIVDNQEFRMNLVSTGPPHCVVFVDDVRKVNLSKIGPLFENNKIFPNRINVEFVQIDSPQEVTAIVWERGAGITLACGTGASAVGVAAVLNKLSDRRITVHLPGGDLKIEWDEKDSHVYMTGPATEVFKGSFEYPLG